MLTKRKGLSTDKFKLVLINDTRPQRRGR